MRTSQQKGKQRYSIIGIDFGNENIVIGKYYNGGVDIIDSPIGKHSISNCISCIKKEIRCGVDRNESQIKRRPKNCIIGLKKLIQVDNNELKIQENKFSNVQCDENGILQCGDIGNIHIESMLVEMFKMIKEITQSDYCVVSISSNYSFQERRRIEYACELAKMPCLQCVEDCICIGLYYWTYDIPSFNTINNKETTQMVLNVGESETTCSVFRFHSNSLEIISNETINIGGRDYSYIIKNKCIELMREKEEVKEFIQSLDEEKKLKFYNKIDEDINKFKFSFSSQNVLESTLKIELNNNNEFIENVTKTEFESWFEEYNEVICLLVQRIIEITQKRINLRLTDIEFVGGGSRLGCIKTIIENKLHLNVKNTMNKECVIAKGAALVAVQVGTKLRLLNEIEENFLYLSIERFIEKESIEIGNVLYPEVDQLTNGGELIVENKNKSIITEVKINQNCIGIIKDEIIYSNYLSIGLERWFYCYQPYDIVISDNDDYVFPFQNSSKVQKDERIGQYKYNWVIRNYLRAIECSNKSDNHQIFKLEKEISLNNNCFSDNYLDVVKKEIKELEELQHRIHECTKLKNLFEHYISQHKYELNDKEKEELIEKKKLLRKITDDIEETKRIIGDIDINN
ncbi:heat shock protein 70kD, putative [Entamoeba histolytica HM-3:IMSS]|uniref:Heat shock protein, putative n=6 Tax=Entamoeba histolytica TaxID=5759 RepID=C4M965_ENTH1|nr:heat shock protein, putative [Entamoeba histolytica HM-1:IMSS]EMD48028.1 HSP70, putative [Entamoeba histolytica KU27]EMS11500.1 heat shock protein 70kD, putative [Entamoeba histolytica HM-3:IMSS]ENY61473.1 heat shock protein 70kD, putative [Entamoeba histolytica HM-1:IMSS-A]GAT98185.1 heat shock protein putative [Entamoeba histolytica]EAL48612.1 heat shock protein, putative [Entamoeba histolytica HM-1:IMSS]|eukprot:XP_653998.1 heat shock protein, putative [Entamoeba histolytica HM-1:IMSS]